MTSGQFEYVDPRQIIVNRDTRQRKELKGIPELRDSISRIGLIHPPVITREMVLRTGERRLTAILDLGWTSIPIQWADQMTEADAQRLELEENIKRVDIDWPDQCRAVLAYHELQLAENEKWGQVDTANALGMSQQLVGAQLDVARELRSGNKMVTEAPKLSTAIGIVARTKERKAQAVSVQMLSVTNPAAAQQIVEKQNRIPLLHADFHEWVAVYTGPRHFNLIHCDFPYGVDADKHHQGQAAAQGGYSDTFEDYNKLIGSLELAMDSVVAPSAHLLFWFSMDYYSYTLESLKEIGWDVQPRPLVWMKNDGTGIIPDPARGPRWIYETAFLASRGDRKIVRAKANAFAHPGKDKSIHMSEKPVPMLKHFMEMLVDDSTIMLDPTCGSGNAVKAAQSLGAPTVLGLERDEEFYNRAREAYLNE